MHTIAWNANAHALTPEARGDIEAAVKNRESTVAGPWGRADIDRRGQVWHDGRLVATIEFAPAEPPAPAAN